MATVTVNPGGKKKSAFADESRDRESTLLRS